MVCVCWVVGLTLVPTSLLYREENQTDYSESLLSRDEPCSPDLGPGVPYYQGKVLLQDHLFSNEKWLATVS